ncbi:MAG TPA: xanthine dehydrogenase accessory protein XdhC [Lacipirellulaceae bacterium]|jgi:xanthine dehydrogenase accessory factor
MSTPHGFIEKLAELSKSGAPFVSVTMVEAIGSTPQDAGTKMLVDRAGLVFGTVGGGKVENQAIEFAQQMLGEKAAPAGRLVEWNLQRDVGMTCGGEVKLYFEAFNHRAWRIVVFGAGHVAQALVRCLLEMECQIVCVDPRADWLAKLPQSGKLQKVHSANMPEFVGQITDNDFVVCMTMGHASDRPILEEVFRQDRHPPYLGVIGSAAKRKVMLRELAEAGIAADIAENFRCPIGLALGKNQPGEIAISIAAELIQVRDAIATPPE